MTLYLHGLGATGDVWRGYAGLCPDLPGHGSMSWDPPYTFERHAHAVAHLLTSPAPVVGHSMGGVVGLALAAMHPELVTAVVGIGIKVAWSDDDVARAQALAAKSPVVFASREEAVDRFLKVSGLAGLLDEPLERAVVEVDGGWRLAQDPATFGVGVPDMAGLVAAARCPVVLARGEHDAMVSHEELAELVPSPVTLPGLGHNAHVEKPEAVLALL
ncbi:MAG TPA: alpha/beta hydrolase [Nocardioidaceae bacterium]|nr:alpha/beta hydrolase [Nocardioidaceae bacterium]